MWPFKEIPAEKPVVLVELVGLRSGKELIVEYDDAVAYDSTIGFVLNGEFVARINVDDISYRLPYQKEPK